MKLKLSLPLCLALLLPGCVPSVNPLYTEKDLVFDPALIGTWGESDSKETWVFEKSGDKKYKLLQTDNEERTAEFEVHLVKLKEHLFLDLYLINPGPGEWKINDLAKFGFIIRPAHMFLKVTQIEPKLQMSFLDPSWLKELVEKDPKAIGHEKLRNSSDQKEEQIVLTASTKDLQSFVLKYVNDEKAFGKPGEMEKKEKPKK